MAAKEDTDAMVLPECTLESLVDTEFDALDIDFDVESSKDPFDEEGFHTVGTDPPESFPILNDAVEQRLSDEKQDHCPDLIGGKDDPLVRMSTPDVHKADFCTPRRNSADAAMTSKYVSFEQPVMPGGANLSEHSYFQQPGAPVGYAEPTSMFAEEHLTEPRKQRVVRRCSMPAAFGIGSNGHHYYQQPDAFVGHTEPGFYEEQLAEPKKRRVMRRCSMPAGIGSHEHGNYQQPDAPVGYTEPGFSEQHLAEPRKRKVTRRCSMPAAFGIVSDDFVTGSMRQNIGNPPDSVFHSGTEVIDAFHLPTGSTVTSAKQEIHAPNSTGQGIISRETIPNMFNHQPEAPIEEQANVLPSGHSYILRDPAFEPTPMNPVQPEPMAVPYSNAHSAENHDLMHQYDFEPTPIAEVQQAAVSTPTAVDPSNQPNHSSKSVSDSTPVLVAPLHRGEAALPSDPSNQPNLMDHEVFMSNLHSIMSKSQGTAKQLQEWDRKNGLPRSHSQTMIKTGRSRTQLLEGKILKKWDGSPLIMFEKAADGSVVVTAGPKKRSKNKAQRRASM